MLRINRNLKKKGGDSSPAWDDSGGGAETVSVKRKIPTHTQTTALFIRLTCGYTSC